MAEEEMEEREEMKEREETILDALKRTVPHSLLRSSPVLYQAFCNYCKSNDLDPHYTLAEHVFRWFNPDDPHAEEFGREVAACEVNIKLLTEKSSVEDDIKALREMINLRTELGKSISSGDSNLKEKVYKKIEEYLTPSTPIDKVANIMKKRRAQE